MAAQAAAYHAAGVPLRRLAAELRMPVTQVGELVLGYWLHESQSAGLELMDADDAACMVLGCFRPRTTHRLCWSHLSRFYAGRPAVPPAPVARVFTCVECGAQWCRLRPGSPLTCGSRECIAARRRLKNLDRHAAILARVRQGEPYPSIGADFGVTPARISQLANRAGLYRRAARGPLQRAARARRLG